MCEGTQAKHSSSELTDGRSLAVSHSLHYPLQRKNILEQMGVVLGLYVPGHVFHSDRKIIVN